MLTAGCFPENLWRRAINSEFESIKKLSFVSKAEIFFAPNDEFPVPGLNPDVKICGETALDYPNGKLDDKDGALYDRERSGFAVIEFILNQPGFTIIKEEVPASKQEIVPHFLIRIFFPRDFPSKGVGYGFTFSEGSENEYKLPHYPNIMRRNPKSIHDAYWSNETAFSKGRLTTHFPEGAMCLAALNQKVNLSDIVQKVKEYISVNPEMYSSGTSGIKNDGGFDKQLTLYYNENIQNLRQAIRDYTPSRAKPKTTKSNGALPPPPPPAKKKGGTSIDKQRNLPPPPPPPSKRR